MKKIVYAVLPVLFAFTAQAQDESNATASAVQSVSLNMSNSIDLSFVGGAYGGSAIMDFRESNDFVNGVTTPDQELRVRSNKGFTVAVRCEGNGFSYAGLNNQGGALPETALKLRVSKNNTGGAVQAPFSVNSYASLTNTSQDLLVNGTRGGDQTFAVQYKCAPGFNLPAGTYNINVVYTATQQ